MMPIPRLEAKTQAQPTAYVRTVAPGVRTSGPVATGSSARASLRLVGGFSPGGSPIGLDERRRREIMRRTPARDRLKALADRCPPPASWLDDEEDWDL
jgi:hypothetical protein